jgi:hypothetical protein
MMAGGCPGSMSIWHASICKPSWKVGERCQIQALPWGELENRDLPNGVRVRRSWPGFRGHGRQP